MKIGSKRDAKTFIILKDGVTLYLSNSLKDLEYQIVTRRRIEVITSNFFPKHFIILKTNIEKYGEITKWKENSND